MIDHRVYVAGDSTSEFKHSADEWIDGEDTPLPGRIKFGQPQQAEKVIHSFFRRGVTYVLVFHRPNLK